MASHNVYTFFSVHNCLDEDFDAPDEGDRDLCRAIVVGKAGMHPDGWDTRSGLTAVMPQGFNGYEWVPERYRRPIARSAAAIAERERQDAQWEAKHRRRPVEEPKPKPPRRKPPKPWQMPQELVDGYLSPAHGTLQLTCDNCRARFRVTMHYRGNRPAVVQSIRLMGKTEGWTCIAGTDRCPRCSQPAAPEPVGNGAGGDQGDEQHA
jgi:hypothetical protein